MNKFKKKLPVRWKLDNSRSFILLRVGCLVPGSVLLRASLLGRLEGLREVGNDVVDVLGSHRDADQVLRNARASLLLILETRVS
jgi:hypothetical protein